MERTTTARTLADLGALSEAEAQVLAEIDTGKGTVLGDGTRPDGRDPTRHVRAALIRMLLVPREGDGLPRLHEKGLQIAGAWIPDALDLGGCQIDCNLSLVDARFEAPPVLVSATLDGLNLNRSSLPGLVGDGLRVRGALLLRHVTARGAVRLHGVKVDSDLDCSSAEFEADKDAEGSRGFAFAADGLDVKGKVVLKDVTAQGAVRLVGVKLGGNLDCTRATFEGEKNAEGIRGCALSADLLETKGDVVLRQVTARGEVRLLGANLGGELDCAGATFGLEDGVPEGLPPRVLNVSGARIGGSLFLRNGARVTGTLDLMGAEIGAICDDRGAWPPPGGLLLDRCHYGAFTGGAPADAPARIIWLGRMEPARWGADFWPQPYEQCAKVLREMGHGEDARAVLIAKERLQRAARRARATPEWRRVLAVWDAVLGATVAYGRRPLQAFVWVALFLVIGTVWFRSAEANDALKPNVPVVLRSVEWVECRVGGENRAAGESRMACFLRQPEAASYPRFNAFVYSADTLLPIVSLEMQGFWIPDDRTRAGWWARTYLWVHIAVGWALSLLAVAGFSGLVKSD
jgi:hypothetical protein